MKSENHTHQFMVAYDKDGNFLGGRTSPGEDGHTHVIKRGTITEDSGGHHHRFSHVDEIKIK